MPLPYLISGAFLIVPLRWRRDFLLRNLAVGACLDTLAVTRLVLPRFQDLWARTDDLPDPLDACDERMRIIQDYNSSWGRLCSKAVWLLTNRFGCRCGPWQDQGPFFGPPDRMVPIPGPADLDAYPDLWVSVRCRGVLRSRL